MNTVIGTKELRKNMQKYIDEVERGEEVLVMKSSKPVFRLTKPYFPESVQNHFRDLKPLKEILAGITKENQHDLVDWGSPVGKEVW